MAKRLTKEELEYYYNLIAMHGVDKEGIRLVNTDLLEREDMADTPENRELIRNRYARAHPNYKKLSDERSKMYENALERRYRHYLLQRTHRNNRHELLLDEVLDKFDSATIYDKIVALEGLDYVTAIAKIIEILTRFYPDAASIHAVYDTMLRRSIAEQPDV